MDTIAVQLRSLATEYRDKADFFDIAADLQEQGYQSDEARITEEVESRTAATIAEKDSTIADLQKQLDAALQPPEEAV